MGPAVRAAGVGAQQGKAGVHSEVLQGQEVSACDESDADEPDKHEEGDSAGQEGLRHPQEEEGGARARVHEADPAVDEGQGPPQRARAGRIQGGGDGIHVRGQLRARGGRAAHEGGEARRDEHKEHHGRQGACDNKERGGGIGAELQPALDQHSGRRHKALLRRT